MEEISAILAVAYESFLKARLERRDGRRGKVHARAVLTALDMMAGTIAEAASHDPKGVWHLNIAEFDRGRGDIEADVLAHHGFVVPEHEWPAFLEWVEVKIALGVGAASSYCLQCAASRHTCNIVG